MAWQIMPNLQGKVFVPECRHAGKKHTCPDCSICQNCSRERCRLCRTAAAVDGDRSHSHLINPE